ncbi:aquaporin-like protein, partial [Microthyrium microscopicum]
LKNHLVATLGEFVGTTMFLFFAFAGTQAASILSAQVQLSTDSTDAATALLGIQKLVYISLSFGFSLMVNVWIFFRISGGLFNPAVTLALLLTRAIPPLRAPFLLLAQLAGGIAASALVLALFPAPTYVNTSLSTSEVKGVFIEGFLTAELVFTILMLAKEKHKATFMAPVGIGLALFIAELVGVQWTGGSLNPARSFGPAVVTGSFKSEHWVYWVGPIAGSLIAVSFYVIIKGLEYEMVNPGQDAD